VVKCVYCIRKRADVSTDAFNRYWLNEHGPKVAAVASTLGLVRYVQSHITSPALNALLIESRGLAPAYDGITEVWWEHDAVLMNALATPEGQSAMQSLIDDESTFIDLAKSSVFMTHEHVIVG
jgi:uncharacterized protein (TIGR02118 family)